MTDRHRCHCGEMPVTADGYCRQHAPKRPAPTLEEQLAECKRARHWLNEDLIKSVDQVLTLKSRVQHLEALLMRVQIGDIKPEEINRWT